MSPTYMTQEPVLPLSRFLVRNRMDMDLDKREGAAELGGVERGESIIRIYDIKNDFQK